MKRRDLIKALEKLGARYHREGSKHTIYKAQSGETLEVPRHKEVSEALSRALIRKAGER